MFIMNAYQQLLVSALCVSDGCVVLACHCELHL